jgi:hypothetical protein
LRLKKKWLTYGVIIGLVATLASLGIVQAQQMGEKSKLSEELDTAEHNLSMLEAGQSSSWQDETDTQTNGTQPDFANARSVLSRPVDSIIANEYLFDIAAASSVTLTSITVSPLFDDVLTQLPCSYLPLNISAEGNVTALLDFISRLNTDLTNGLVKSAILSIPETPAEGEALVDIELIVYTYQGE